MYSAESVVDFRYVPLLGRSLERFHRIDRNSYAFRCPLCGDSRKNRSKTRGYIFEYRGRAWFKCHNCGASKTFRSLLSEVDPVLYDEYRLELAREKFGRPTNEGLPDAAFVAPKPTRTDSTGIGLDRVIDLPVDHPARVYLEARLVPTGTLDRVYWTDAYYAWVNTLIPGKFGDSALSHDGGRIVFPFVDAEGSFNGASGRSIDGTEPRYVSIKTRDAPKAFGLDRVDRGRRVYVVEGQIDSLFLPNAVAMVGSSVDMGTIGLDRASTTVVYDCEPRNAEIVASMGRMIDDGWTVCVWPDGVPGKDINEMVLAGWTVDRIVETIDRNASSGLRARLRLNNWKRT